MRIDELNQGEYLQKNTELYTELEWVAEFKGCEIKKSLYIYLVNIRLSLGNISPFSISSHLSSNPLQSWFCLSIHFLILFLILLFIQR